MFSEQLLSRDVSMKTSRFSVWASLPPLLLGQRAPSAASLNLRIDTLSFRHSSVFQTQDLLAMRNGKKEWFLERHSPLPTAELLDRAFLLSK